MPGPAIDVEVFGETVLRRRLLRMEHGLTDASDAFRAIAGILSRATARNFATRGQSGGHPWPPLKRATIARKRRMGLDTRILRASSRLYDSLVNAQDSEHIEDVGDDFLRWGSAVDYGVFHQSRRPRTRLPFRPPVALSENAKRSAVRELQRAALGERAA